MDNYLLMKKSKELEDFSKSLGFEKTYFWEDFEILETDSKKELLRISGKKKVIFRAPSEELLRFALEKTKVFGVIGMEKINPKDSLHFVRGGLDQVLCKIAAEKDKVVVFSFSEILNAKDKGKLLKRISFNAKLCKKYKVKVLFSTFASSKTEMRSVKDLEALSRVLRI
ncbi:MAG: hypothetical protein KJ598_05990 [Nanoarchaeota archaeon]|nr:hypothetical protein [Nanoarchaeota archaeon]MBU1644675.1 hypothetical protein [Nanoarchaeota archaeon]